jgi:hypothetical protein
MAQMDRMKPSAGGIDARIHGDVRGQVAVGTNILQNNVSHGGVVYVAAPGQIPTVRRRSSPVQLAGRAEPPLLGRDADLEQVVSALEPAGTFQVCGPAGSGKTSLLKSVLHGPLAGTAADGVVYHNTLTEPVEDTLQSLFEAFYTSDLPFKPTEGDLRNALQPIQALVALDDVSQEGPGRISQVLDAAPNTMILLASSRPLAGAGSSLSLRGLTEEAALSVLERGLDRSLTARERPPARSIVRALEGQPLRLVQVAGVVRELKRSLPALAREMRSGDGVETLAETIFSSLGDDQRDVLALLAAMDQAPLYVDSVAELTDIAEVGPVVESLLLLALVQAHSPRYSLTAELSEDQHGDLGSDGWRDRVLESLPEWVERQREPEAVVREAAAILQALEDGVARRAWAKVLRLGRTVETPLILAGRWGAWEAALRHQLRAARGLGDKGAQGWSLHQLGTRALCLGDAFTARANLSEALRIRESLGDVDGAAVTRHNLDFLSGPPPPPRTPEAPPPPPPSGWHSPVIPTGPPPKSSGGWRVPVLTGAAAVVVVALVLAGLSWRDASDGGRSITSVDLLGGELSAEALDFGDQEVGTTGDVLGAGLANSGDEPVTVDTVTLTGASPDEFLVSDDPCTGASIEPGGTCTLGVRFSPGTVGLRHATLVIAREGGTLPVVLRGNGTASVAAETTIPPPGPTSVETTVPGPGPEPGPGPAPVGNATVVLVASPSSLAFPDQPLGTAGAARAVTVRNGGTALAELDRVALTGAHAGDFLLGSDECAGRTLSPGAGCTVTVGFRPSQTGARSASLEVVPDEGPPLRLALQGTGAPSADLSVDLENKGGGTFTLTLKNAGPSQVSDAILIFSGFFLSDDDLAAQEGLSISDEDEDNVECSSFPSSIRCTVSELNPDDTVTMTLHIACTKVTAKVQDDVFDSDTSNNEDSRTFSCPG